ncbi:MAG: S8 family serine peptidase, partial [Planctomycetota bacterium]|nr:S8 family serine peptidase [Planctomycetota bacterium]
MRTPSVPTRVLALVLFAGLLASGPGLRAEEESPGAFPADGLMPKQEIGADRFLAAHPTADGRGITVAIFDTGVDPGAPGLQTTSDGKPKIVDLVDGSGSGDVDTSTVRQAKDGSLAGLSGRTLKLGKHRCPSGAWHVGLKPAFELFPAGLVRRLKAKRRQGFDETQRGVRVALQRAHAAAKARKAKPAAVRELALRLEQLDALAKAYADPGPIYDCVVFHDGKVWRAVIDTDEDGDLGDEKALATYRLEHEWSTFSDEDRLNYGVNVYDKGNRLSIVVDCGAHGTHVAGIVAAHYPDKPELNGIAPGAQIVAVKIGDTRMDSSSTGTGEERGLVAVMRNGCQLINMSYGGPTPTPNKTRMEKLYAEVVNEHGVIFVASAGNEGPALSTVGAPGGTSSALFGVGAYVSPRMMRAQYAMRKTAPSGHFTWSSRGPTLDGDMGVDFSAPGGAIAPVPNWLLQGSTQMNGTSMSSPNLCGAVALLLSGMKQKSIGWSAHRVHRALANTAVRPEGLDVFGMGHGLIQVPEAFDYLTRWRDRPEEDVRFGLTLPGRQGARGLYLREPEETDRVAVERVRVKPAFREEEDHESRIAFSMRLRLESSQPWIEVPEHLALQHGGGRFEIRVDPRELARGQVHFGEVRAIDVEHPERGTIFHLPVTVVRPEPVVNQRWQATLPLEAGAIERKFFAVPQGATWADLRLRSVDADAKRLIVLQTQQLLPGRGTGEDVYEKYISMDPGEVSVHGFKVAGGRTLEIALAQYWSSLGKGTFEAEVVFHGIEPSSEVVRLDGAGIMGTVDVTVPCGRE